MGWFCIVVQLAQEGYVTDGAYTVSQIIILILFILEWLSANDQRGGAGCWGKIILKVGNVFTGTLHITWFEVMGYTIITTKIGHTAYILT